MLYIFSAILLFICEIFKNSFIPFLYMFIMIFYYHWAILKNRVNFKNYLVINISAFVICFIIFSIGHYAFSAQLLITPLNAIGMQLFSVSTSIYYRRYISR